MGWETLDRSAGRGGGGICDPKIQRWTLGWGGGLIFDSSYFRILHFPGAGSGSEESEMGERRREMRRVKGRKVKRESEERERDEKKRGKEGAADGDQWHDKREVEREREGQPKINRKRHKTTPDIRHSPKPKFTFRFSEGYFMDYLRSHPTVSSSLRGHNTRVSFDPRDSKVSNFDHLQIYCL